MKLSKLLWKLRLVYLEWQQRCINPDRMEPLALHAKLTLLNPKWLEDLSLLRTQQLSGEFSLASLKAYSSYLDEMSAQIVKGELIKRERLKLQREPHDIRMFLKHHQGHYTDPVKDVTEFKRSALKLLEVFPVEKADHGINCHYQMMLNQTLNEVNQLTNLLLEVSRR